MRRFLKLMEVRDNKEERTLTDLLLVPFFRRVGLKAGTAVCFISSRFKIKIKYVV